MQRKQIFNLTEQLVILRFGALHTHKHTHPTFFVVRDHYIKQKSLLCYYDVYSNCTAHFIPLHKSHVDAYYSLPQTGMLLLSSLVTMEHIVMVTGMASK